MTVTALSTQNTRRAPVGAPTLSPVNDDLDEKSRRLAMKYADRDALGILRVAIKEEFAGRIALVSSFGAESAALLHLAAQIDKNIPVLFLETGKHFAQTLSYRKKLAAKLGLTNVRDIRPAADSVATRDFGGDLWKEGADACCTLRKVEPLTAALDEFDAWITGRKQFHGGGRVNLPAFEASPTHVKVNPLIRWSKDDIEAYFKEHELPRHQLTAQGYPSIGCWPCTHPADGDDVRGGRWRGAAKTECGIHGK